MVKLSFSLETSPDLQPERKWCPYCEDWFTPRPCNAKKQKRCCKTPACKRASHNASNRKWHRKRSRDADWRHVNVLRAQRNRRVRRDGFDADAVAEAADRFFGNLNELLRFVDDALRLLASIKSLLLPTPLLRKLSGSPETIELHMGMARNRVVSSSERAVSQLNCIPAFTLRENDLARCA